MTKLAQQLNAWDVNTCIKHHSTPAGKTSVHISFQSQKNMFCVYYNSIYSHIS